MSTNINLSLLSQIEFKKLSRNLINNYNFKRSLGPTWAKRPFLAGLAYLALRGKTTRITLISLDLIIGHELPKEFFN